MMAKETTSTLLMTSKARRFQGYGVLNYRNELEWGSLYPDRETAKRHYERHNPDRPYRIVAVSLELGDIES